MNFKKTTGSVLLVSLLGVTLSLTACSQSINIPSESGAPTSYPLGSTTKDGTVPNQTEVPTSGSSDPLDPNFRPSSTFPKVTKDDSQYDVKTTLMDDIEKTRQYVVIKGDLNPSNPSAPLDATASSKTTTVNEANNPYVIQITNPNTTIKVTGNLVDGYIIIASNSELKNFTITYNSTMNKYVTK